MADSDPVPDRSRRRPRLHDACADRDAAGAEPERRARLQPRSQRPPLGQAKAEARYVINIYDGSEMLVSPLLAHKLRCRSTKWAKFGGTSAAHLCRDNCFAGVHFDGQREMRRVQVRNEAGHRTKYP